LTLPLVLIQMTLIHRLAIRLSVVSFSICPLLFTRDLSGFT